MHPLNTRKFNLAQFTFATLSVINLVLAGCATVTNKPIGAEQENAKAISVLETKQANHQASLIPINEFTLDGRIGVQADGRGFSGKMRWQHLHQNNKIDLYSPLGSKVVGIESHVDGVTLTSSDGNAVTSTDVESLTEQTMGWRLPAHYLEDWVLGRPTDAPIMSAIWDEEGRLSKLNQDGWEIQYLSYQNNGNLQLPSKLNLRNAKLYLKLVIDNWQIANAQTETSTKTSQ